MNGKTIKKAKKSDFNKFNAQSYGSLYIDTKVIAINLSHYSFPYIIEYVIVRKIKEGFRYPSWSPKIDYNLLNLSSTFKLSVENKEDIKIYEQNLPNKTTSINNFPTIYKWQVDSIQPIANESYSYSEYWEAPKVLIAPKKFFLEKHGGNTSWNDFGNWIVDLNKGRSELTIKEKNIVDSLLKDTEDEFQKIDILYNYLQNNTRYVSIQVGIGGWQPYQASYVCENKYGDCKALTNYMYALLKHAGITSHYALIKAGTNTCDIITDFSINQFNHAILMIPLSSGPIWLDCTSKVTPTGFVEKFIADRHALIIIDNNSYLAKTPSYNSTQNVEQVNGTFHINTNLTGKGEVVFKKYAHRSSSSRSLHKFHHSNTQKHYLRKEINLSDFTIKSDLHSETIENFVPVTIDTVDLKVNIAGKKAGTDLFLTYPLAIQINDIEIDNRKTDIYIQNSYARTDSILYILPEGYSLTEPDNFQADSEFGTLKYSIKPNGNNALLTARYTLNKGRYSKEKIQSFKKFINYIRKIESYEIIVSKME